MHIQSDFVNTTLEALTEAPSNSPQVINFAQCTTSAGIVYKFHGSPETVFWVLTGIAVISLNSFCIYHGNNTSRPRTLYIVLLNSLMATNIYAGVVIHSIFAYLSQTSARSCNLLNIFAGCCIFNLMSTLLSVTLITINRFMILRSVRAMQQNHFLQKVSKRTSYCVYVSILSLSLAITLIRAYFPAIGSIVVTTLGTALTLLVMVLLCILHYKLHRISLDRSESSVSPDCGIQPFKRSLYVLRLTILSLIVLCMPFIIIFIILRVFKFHSGPLAISITAKLIWFRPVVDPIADLLFVLKSTQFRRRAVVQPAERVKNLPM